MVFVFTRLMISHNNVDRCIEQPDSYGLFRALAWFKRGNSMKKGVPIILGAVVAALMITSLLTAVNSETIVAKNAALVVTSHPVIASDTTLSELEPEKYNAMMNSFHPENDTAVQEPDGNTDSSDGAETVAEQTIPTTGTGGPEAAAAVALADAAGAGTGIDAPPSAGANESADTEVAAEAEDTTRSHPVENPVDAEAESEQDSSIEIDTASTSVNETATADAAPGAREEHTVYTVQAGSYAYRINAEKKYEALAQTMHGADLDKLRIEKVGQYYTVRLGSFDHYVTAMKFLNAIGSDLSSAIVLEAYIKNDRIVAQHGNPMLAGK